MSTEKTSGRSLAFLYVGGVVLIGMAAVAVVLLSHTRSSQAREEIDSRAKAIAAGPKVLAAKAGRSAPERRVEIQAEARPFLSVTLYAKIAGYLADIHVDKGDHVKKGQVLARIEAPEIDHELSAARADAKNKRVNANRTQALVEPGAVSQEEADLAVANAEVAEAQVDVAVQQTRYELLRAPFDGTVTARYADPGALLQAATGSATSSQPLVVISDVDRLRVYGYVDQRDAAFIKAGDAAEIVLPDDRSRPVIGKVGRVSGELDTKTRMMLVEVDLDNRDHRIVPGSFVRETLALSVPSLVTVPLSAIVVRGGKPFVAVITKDESVTYRPVKIADQDGTTARLLDGVAEGDLVATNLGDGINEGSHVQPIFADAPKVGAAK